MLFFQTTYHFLEILTKPFVVDQELQLLSPEVLRTDIQLILYGFLASLGQRMPYGHTWKELAQEIHGGSDDKEFLLSSGHLQEGNRE